MNELLLATIDTDHLLTTVVYLVVIGLVFWLLWWLIDYCAPPEPFKKISKVLVALVAVVLLVKFLLDLIGKL